MRNTVLEAIGRQGIESRWKSIAKSGVGTALNRKSKVWFTISHCIVNEIYYARIDQAAGVRWLDRYQRGRFFSEERRDTEHSVEWIASGVPGFRLTNSCVRGLYRIEKEILSDPKRDTVLKKRLFSPQRGKMGDYQIYVLLSPQLGIKGYYNIAWVDEFEGTPVLFVRREENSLALTCSARFLKQSAGYVGLSDDWQDLRANYQMTWNNKRAEDGNVALTAEIELTKSNGMFVLWHWFASDCVHRMTGALGTRQDNRRPSESRNAGRFRMAPLQR